MIRAIIFDVDGVLVDSKEANLAFFGNLLRQAGYDAPTREDVLDCFHLPMRQTIEKLTHSNDVVEVDRICELAKDPSLRPSHLLVFPPRLLNVLEDLHARYKLAIVTSRIKVGMDDVFGASPIGHLFDEVVTFEDYDNPKPHPQPLQVALHQLGIAHDEAIYIGDSDTDIEAAKAAGMKSIHLANVKHVDAHAHATTFNEIRAAIAKIDVL